MAHTKAKGTSKLGRDSHSQRLGVKLFGGEKVKPGMIIVRQRGTKYFPGENVALGSDDTIFSLILGKVCFLQKKRKRYDNKMKDKTFVGVKPLAINKK